MTEGTHSTDAGAVRKGLRPVLIASQRNVTEHTTVLRRLVVGLADESIPVALVCPTQCDSACVAPAPVDIFSHPLIDLPILERLGIEPLAILLEKFKPTVLHCLCESRATLAHRLAARLEIPYILSVNSLVGRFTRLSISSRWCAKLVVPTRTVASQVAKARPRFADRIKHISMGTFSDADIICFSDTSRVPSMVVAYPLNRPSDLVHLLNAIKTLLGEGREFMTVIMGHGAAEDKLRRFLVTRGLSQAVTIVPILNPWRSVLAAGDIFVQPRPSRTFSVFLLEAMSLGAAVAACKGGVDDLIIPDRTAVLFDPDSESSIGQALAQLLDNQEFARNLACSAQEHVRTNYSVSTMISATLDIYSQVQVQLGT
jgi:glycosyltransferase involved in cell wall biosynthesis